MVCLGNICRSPLAEGILRAKAAEAGINVEIDSAGISNYHDGESPDHRAMETASQFGVDISYQRARKVQSSDYSDFDLLLAMDRSVYEDLNSGAEIYDKQDKVELFLHYSGQNDVDDVPDPYYGGSDGFKNVYKLIDEACERIVDRWQMMGIDN